MFLGASNKSLVLNQGKLYSKTTAPFGIKFSSQTFLGNLPENPYVKCEIEPSRRDSKTKNSYKLNLVSEGLKNSNGGITANSYTGNAACRRDADIINDLIKYEKNFTYQLTKSVSSYFTFWVGLIFLLVGMIIPFGKEVSPEELNSKKVFSRDLTHEEFETFKKKRTASA